MIHALPESELSRAGQRFKRRLSKGAGAQVAEQRGKTITELVVLRDLKF